MTLGHSETIIPALQPHDPSPLQSALYWLLNYGDDKRSFFLWRRLELNRQNGRNLNYLGLHLQTGECIVSPAILPCIVNA